MSIPDNAVEAAARVFYASQTGADNLDTSTHREAWLRIAERALEATAGAMYAQALRDAADLVDAEDQDVDYEEISESAGRRHAAEELEARARELEEA